jgi:predicted DNA-binding antitoxin AbrB/MazE fold protein
MEKRLFMLQTLEAIIDEKGILRLLDPVDLPKMRRVIVTILNEEPTKEVLDRTLRTQKIAAMEQRQAEGYAKHPSKKDEFSEWESEQVWGES